MPTNSSIVLDFRPAIDEYTQNGKNVWDTAYQNAMLPYEQQLSSATSQFEYGSERLEKDYGEAINKAYESYITNKRAAEFSSYGTGDIRNMTDAMGKAYDENKRSIFETYLANQESLDTKYGNVVSSYYKQALSTQNLLEQEKNSLAENYTKIVYSVHGYLNKLLENNPELFKTNPLLNQFVYFDEETGDLMLVDEKGFIEALSETNLDTGETTLKSKGGLQDVFNLVTSIGGLNDKNTLSYESYMRENESDLYSWLSSNNNQNLYQMYDILGFNPQGLFGQGIATQDTLANTFGEGDNAVTMYTVREGGKEYKPLDPTNFKADGDNIVIYGQSFNLASYSKEEISPKINGVLNYMSTGSSKPAEGTISKNTIQIYDNNIYKYDGKRWIRMIDGDNKVSDVIAEINNVKSGKYEKAAKSVGTPDIRAGIAGGKYIADWSEGGFLGIGVDFVTNFNGKKYTMNYVKENSLPGQILNYMKEHELEVIEYNGKLYVYGKHWENGNTEKRVYELTERK